MARTSLPQLGIALGPKGPAGYPPAVKIAVFLPNWLGDLVMATPTLRAIRRLFGVRGRIVGILRPNLAELLAGTDFLDEQWLFDPRAVAGEQRRWGLVRRMRREQFDLALLLTNSLHTALLAWLGGATERVGYARDFRGPLLSGRVYPRREDGRIVPAPVVETYLALAEAIGCPPEPPRLELATTSAEEQRAEAAWRELGLPADGRVIALNSSGAYGAAKHWPAEHFAALARRIALETEHHALVVCGPQERDVAREIVERAGHPRVVSLADQPLGIGLTKACLQRCRLAVSTDSGPRHIAAALGKPVVTLFGPTLPVWVENPLVHAVDLQLPLDCAGCGERTCPLEHHRCMRELTPDTVYAAVERLLAEPSAMAA